MNDCCSSLCHIYGQACEHGQTFADTCSLYPMTCLQLLLRQPPLAALRVHVAQCFQVVAKDPEQQFAALNLALSCTSLENTSREPSLKSCG